VFRVDAGGKAPRTLTNHVPQNFLTIPVDRCDLAQIDDTKPIPRPIQ
jgi:hypothetical protein